MPEKLQGFATAPKGLGQVLLLELQALGVEQAVEKVAGVAFTAALSVFYRICLHSRIANRVILVLDRFVADHPDTLARKVSGIPWEDHFGLEQTFAVFFSGKHPRITHSGFGAQRVKDGIVDRFREQCGRRPSVEKKDPDFRVHVFAERDGISVGIDLAGESLHRRGYRLEQGAAPLKENLAAAILMRAHWPLLAERGGGFVDPMCGAGTLVIEAALMARRMAPGLSRSRFAFMDWKGHRPDLWQTLSAEAEQQVLPANDFPLYCGYDADPEIIQTARANAARAGVGSMVRFEVRGLQKMQSFGPAPGLVAVNPPYGERLGESEALIGLYRQLGDGLKVHAPGWRAAVLTGDVALGKSLGLRAEKVYALFNGALPCKLLLFSLSEEHFVAAPPQPLLPPKLSDGATMMANRLRKNLRNLRTWLRRDEVTCFRLYDADMPEYAVAVDVYQAEKMLVHVQEYAAPKSIDVKAAQDRLEEALAAVRFVLDVPEGQVFLKTRRKRKGGEQYTRLSVKDEFHRVQEGGCRFLVDLQRTLDTGLFLDHREVRGLVGQMAKGRRFLNLFAYTGSATVYAAKGGAATTTTVDQSQTYLDWAQRNLALNHLHGARHRFIKADCRRFLAHERGRYDLIFLDPPTFSNSKSNEEDFDVQRDHVTFIRQCMRLLSRDGVLIFSNNYRRFQLEEQALSAYLIEDVSKATLPPDFARNSKIHACFLIRHR